MVSVLYTAVAEETVLF